jgi:hypothetical protein
MKYPFKLSLLSVALSATLLTGCGGAKTTITELKPPAEESSEHDHASDLTIDSLGRLAITAAGTNQVSLYDLDDNTLLDSFTTSHDNSTISTSAGFRYVVVKNRSQGYVGFIDSGLWREDHVAHLHDYKQAPIMLSYDIHGSQPTHVVTHDGKMAIFNDGNEQANLNATVSVLSDNDISTQSTTFATIDLAMNMHGVAEPKGDHLLATLRRDDNESTSANKILPDQVAVYHLHNGAYEQEQILTTICPNLHGAAQNQQYVAFGCSDGVLIAHEHNGEFEASKIVNTVDLGELRIGQLIGDEHSNILFGIASGHGGGSSKLLAIDPEKLTMEAVNWQPVINAKAISYAFSSEAKYFVILDDQGFLTTLKPHVHQGHTDWEFEQRIDFTEQDVSMMPKDQAFKITMSPNAQQAYISDPIDTKIININLSDASVGTALELDFIPANLTWLGIAEDHDH